jgi:hypothetical protein
LINSRLLALGNVISALKDPSRVKSHTASYISHQDSKFAQLSQASLGGNAHTLMITCVNTTGWNMAETVNTLKYANRARNAKNQAVVNEQEEVWDDVEQLQNMVMRLRKELKALKEGGLLTSTDSNAPTSFKLGHTPMSSIATITSSESHHPRFWKDVGSDSRTSKQLRGPLGTVYAMHGRVHPSPKGISREGRKLSKFHRSDESI